MNSDFSRLRQWVVHHRWRLLLLFVGVLVPLFIFGKLAREVSEREVFPFDAPLLLYLHNHATPAWDRIMLTLSLLGFRFGVVPVDIAVGLVLLARHRRGDLFFWIASVGGTAVLNLAAKSSFERVRPDYWISMAPETTYSFPSGHAMSSMALAVAAAVLAWPTRWRWPVTILGGLFTLLVGISRAYLGVHYPSDILAGWAASLAWVIGVSLALYRSPAKPQPQTEPE